MRRIDYTSGLPFSTATVPGATAGGLTTDQVPRRPLDLLVGVRLIVLGWHGG